jgi:putative SOS response-associated peptidase YedK
MCGRFAQYTPAEALARQFGVTTPLLEGGRPSWNVSPSQPSLVVRRNPDTGFRHLDLLVWGLVPHWVKDFKTARRPINARSETVATSPVFSPAYAKRRCLVLVDAWYEWKPEGKVKQPYAFAAHDRIPLALAGLWESWRADGTGKILRTFTILTTKPNKLAASVHDRMPVVIPPASWALWLGEQVGDPNALLRPVPDDVLEIWPVSRAVGTPQNNGPDLLKSVSH